MESRLNRVKKGLIIILRRAMLNKCTRFLVVILLLAVVGLIALYILRGKGIVWSYLLLILIPNKFCEKFHNFNDQLLSYCHHSKARQLMFWANMKVLSELTVRYSVKCFIRINCEYNTNNLLLLELPFHVLLHQKTILDAQFPDLL